MPSYLSYRRSLSVLDQDNNIESWITVNGNHIPIMKGQTKAEAVRAFVESRRKESKKDDGIIRYGDENYGKAGKYEVFRSGKTNAPNGTIFTSSTFVGANTYSNTQPDRETVERYNVNLKNPLVIEGSSDVDNLRKTYKALFGKEINPDKPLDQTTWPKYDEMIMRKLKKTKYDSIITKVNGNPKEIQLPDWTPMIQTGSYKRYDNDYENEEYKAAAKEDSENAKRYWDFVNNEYRSDNEEDQKRELELRGIMNNSYAGAVAFLKADDYYRKESGQSLPLENALNQALSDIKSGNTTSSSGISSRQIALGASKIHLPEKEAAKCAEQIIEYTRNADKGDRALIDKAIWNSDPYNEKTFSGVEGKWNRDFKVGDEINGRLISWSKNPLVAIQFESIDDTRKILVIDENPGMDISDFSQESDEEEVLTATNMNFVVKEIKQWEGFDLINLEYKGKKQ